MSRVATKVHPGCAESAVIRSRPSAAVPAAVRSRMKRNEGSEVTSTVPPTSVAKVWSPSARQLVSSAPNSTLTTTTPEPSQSRCAR